MKVSLAPSFRPVKAEGTQIAGAPLLEEGGPRVVLGWSPGDVATPLSPAAASLFGPRGVCLHPDGTLWVADTGHHRLLGWRKIPQSDNEPADILIGQPSFCREGRNAKGPPGPATLNVPTGLCAWRGGLAVADAWNHRVLIWREVPTGNGQPADLVLGQHDFSTRDENAGGEVTAMSMRWPHGACWWNGHLALADSGNNRVMLWRGFPEHNGSPCDAILGQRDTAHCDHNMSSYYPSAASVNMPYATVEAGGQLIVADTANSRLLGWADSATGIAANQLCGQPDFASKGDNRWGMPERDSLCWPYGLSALGDLVAVADSGNNRVLLWNLAR